MINFHIITIFPGAFDSYIKTSVLKRALDKKIVKINLINLRDFARDSRKTVDDKAYGGGPGMVLKVEPIYRAVRFLKSGAKNQKSKTRTILFSTRGKKFDSKIAKRLSHYNNLILICGKYEGVDERVARYIADEEISIGDYVLSGGELAALVLMETTSRFIPGFLGKKESLEEIKGSYPVYTRPEIFTLKSAKKSAKKLKVPSVLLSGDHEKIIKWRKENGKK